MFQEKPKNDGISLGNFNVVQLKFISQLSVLGTKAVLWEGSRTRFSLYDETESYSTNNIELVATGLMS